MMSGITNFAVNNPVTNIVSRFIPAVQPPQVIPAVIPVDEPDEPDEWRVFDDAGGVSTEVFLPNVENAYPTIPANSRQKQMMKNACDECSICHGLIKGSGKYLQCAHRYCKTCITGWINARHRDCPICRQRIKNFIRGSPKSAGSHSRSNISSRGSFSPVSAGSHRRRASDIMSMGSIRTKSKTVYRN